MFYPICCDWDILPLRGGVYIPCLRNRWILCGCLDQQNSVEETRDLTFSLGICASIAPRWHLPGRGQKGQPATAADLSLTETTGCGWVGRVYVWGKQSCEVGKSSSLHGEIQGRKRKRTSPVIQEIPSVLFKRPCIVGCGFCLQVFYTLHLVWVLSNHPLKAVNSRNFQDGIKITLKNSCRTFNCVGTLY